MSKHQKLSLHRTDSTFSFDEPAKLNASLLTSYRKRTPSEREMIARALKRADLDKDRGEEQVLHFAEKIVGI